MKKLSLTSLLALASLGLSSCASINNFVAKVDFEQKLERGAEISKNLISNSKATKVEIVKAKDIEDFIKIVGKIQKELPDYYFLAHIKNSYYKEEFVSNEESLINFAKSRKYEFIIYVEAEGVRRYSIYKDRLVKMDINGSHKELGEKIKKIKIKHDKDYKLFEAYFLSKEVEEINSTEIITY